MYDAGFPGGANSGLIRTGVRSIEGRALLDPPIHAHADGFVFEARGGVSR